MLCVKLSLPPSHKRLSCRRPQASLFEIACSYQRPNGPLWRSPYFCSAALFVARHLSSELPSRVLLFDYPDRSYSPSPAQRQGLACAEANIMRLRLVQCPAGAAKCGTVRVGHDVSLVEFPAVRAIRVWQIVTSPSCLHSIP